MAKKFAVLEKSYRAENPDPDPAQNLDADPDPDPDPGCGGGGLGQPKMCIPPGKILGTPLSLAFENFKKDPI